MITTSLMLMLSLHSHSPFGLLLLLMRFIVFWVWKFVVWRVLYLQTKCLLKSIFWQFLNLPVFLMELNRLRSEPFSRFYDVESQFNLSLETMPGVTFQEGKEPHLTGKRLSVRKFSYKGVFALFKYDLNNEKNTYWKWMRLFP